MMLKLRSTIIKDIRILTRDRVGLVLMFVMPIILVLVITSIQNSTFELVNDNKIRLLISNKDQGKASKQLTEAIDKIGLFKIKNIDGSTSEKHLSEMMNEEDALLILIIPEDFTERLSAKAEDLTSRTLSELGLMDGAGAIEISSVGPLTLYYNPVLQESYRYSIQSAFRSVLQIVENKLMLESLYQTLNDTDLPKRLEEDIVKNQVQIREIPLTRTGGKAIPNATQHNVPAWTIFAMFFIVISLGSNVVKEKRSGSFIRLKTLPTSFLINLTSKQVTYLIVSMAQVFVIFSIGIWLFPLIGLPALNLPSDIPGLIVVSVVCGWCALSYAICIGVFAQTQEQANGIGAVSIVILAAVGGLLVPSFAMPSTFQFIMVLSPLHWCLESYYGLFLENGKLQDVLSYLLPLLGITIFLQLLAIAGLKRKNLI